MKVVSNIVFFLCLGVIAIVCVTAMSLTVMDPDAAQYAEMSREMLFSNNPLHLFCLNNPYLDKPPLLFWLTALSFKFFGVGSIAYRIPSLLFAFWAVFSIYRFAKLFYTEQIARLSSLILASTFAFALLTNDVRTDTLLLGAVSFSIWQLASYIQKQKTANLFAGSVGISLAMLAKGPIGFFVPVFALLPPLIISRNWKRIFDWKNSIVLIVVAFMLLPMCIGLFQQFGTQGLRFYFWTQSFGRITGENVWHNNPDPFFLVHTTLWAFLPWSLFLFAGLYFRINELLFKKQLYSAKEHISTFGFLLTLFSLMLSKYQLPHYVFVIYPLGAVIAAEAFIRLFDKRWVKVLQISLVVLIWIVVFVINSYLFPAHPLLIVLLGVCLLGTWLIFYYTKELFLLSFTTIISAILLLNINFYPKLQSYQTSEEVAAFLRSEKIPVGKLRVHFSCFSFALSFYYQQVFESCLAPIDLERAFEQQNELYVLIDDWHMFELTTHIGWNTKIVQTYNKFNVTQLNISFLNPKTRANTLQKIHLVKVTLKEAQK